MTKNIYPYLGFGLGLRATHYPYIFDHKPAVDWFEIISENFIDTDGKAKRNLARIKEHYPIAMHGVSLSIGTCDPLNSEYLQKLKALIKWVQPTWISDHLCWTGVAHKNTHDLLPVPYTEENLRHIIKRIQQVQDYLEYPIALENPSTYLEFTQSTLSEAEFIASMVTESGCRLLLDVNNVYVTCYNHRLDAKQYLDTLPLDSVIQIHLSGHSNKGTHIIDTHDDYVVDAVWELYKYVVHKAGRIPNTMIEWDDNIPEFLDLYTELTKAKKMAHQADKYQIPKLFSEHSQQSETVTLLSPLEMQIQVQNAIILGENVTSHPQEWIRSKKDFLPQEQLNVYINAYRYRLHGVVAEDYPILKHYLGEGAFDACIWNFVNTVHSEHFNIAHYALKLPEFIKKTLHNDVFAYELCTLETLIVQLADFPETEPLAHKHLVGMTAETLMETVLYPRKALKLLAFTYSVNAYYCDVMAEKSPENPEACSSYLVVFRHEDNVWRMTLDPQEYHLLTALFTGITVGKALETLDENYAEKLSEWFSRWIRNGILAVDDTPIANTDCVNNMAYELA